MDTAPQNKNTIIPPGTEGMGNTENFPPPVPTIPTGSQFTPQQSVNEVITAAKGGGQGRKGGKGFTLFIILGIVIILAVWGYVGFIFLQNQKLKSSKAPAQKADTKQAKVSPTPAFSKDFVKIQDGNVIYDNGQSDKKVLVNKNEYAGTGITGFLKVSVSPDDKKICFESWPPAPQPALFIADVDGNGVSQINANRKNCLWSNDSKKLFYINITPQTSPANIYMYDLDSKSEKNLTSTVDAPQKTKRFDVVGLSADGSKLICKYDSVAGEQVSGQCEIDLVSFEITYK